VPPPSLRVSVLGPVRAWLDDRELALGPAHQRAVFAMLAASAGRPVTRGDLITGIWGTGPPATAAGSIYTYVSGLRRALTPAAAGLLASGPAGYVLRLGPDALDSAVFAELCAHAAGRQAAGDPAGTVAALDRALALWHGEAYAGLTAGPLELDRARLAERRLAAVEQRARVLLGLGDDSLVAELSGLTGEHPLHEPLYELLMLALHRAGRTAEALDVFEGARRLLADELGVEPGDALAGLARRLRDGAEPPAAPAGLQPLQAARPAGLQPAPSAPLHRLTDGTRQVLRTAALLGAGFTVDELAAVTGRPPLELLANLDEALAAAVVVDAGDTLAFADAAVRRELRDGLGPAERARLHRQAAEVLDGGGAPVSRVAEQLAASGAAATDIAVSGTAVSGTAVSGTAVSGTAVDSWAVAWLVQHRDELVRRAPETAGRLLRQALDSGAAGPDQRPALLVALVRLDFRQQRQPVAEAREAAAAATDPDERAEMRHLLATLTFQGGDPAGAVAVLEAAVADVTTPMPWRTRHRVQLAVVRRGPLDDLDRADHAAEHSHREALAAGDPYAAAFALQTRWRTDSIRRDHARALSYIDRALELLPDHPALAGLVFDLLDNRVFALQNLDQLDEAEATLRRAARYAARHRIPTGLRVTAAVQHYWLGRWDDALAEVSAVPEDTPSVTFLGLREPTAIAMLMHGVAALVAARRDDLDLAGGHLDRAAGTPATGAERDNGDFLLAARAVVAERRGRAAEALETLRPVLDPDHAPMMLRHQWLPDTVRLALGHGRRDIAERAAEICAGEAAREVRPARAHAAADRCRALITGDPAPAHAAAARYRAAGRLPELAAALEDAAVLLATRRRPHEAARDGGEAAALYTRLGAHSDLHRLEQRLDDVGVAPEPPRQI
jgi:DNA-binding SARP family transcriptional activator/tetratricopeptide (TPR) repeat protein